MGSSLLVKSTIVGINSNRLGRLKVVLNKAITGELSLDTRKRLSAVESINNRLVKKIKLSAFQVKLHLFVANAKPNTKRAIQGLDDGRSWNSGEIKTNIFKVEFMTKRSIYDHSAPSPSEELIGICHGIINENSDHTIAFGAIKSWMIENLSDQELKRLEERDPLWNFEEGTSRNAMLLKAEYGKRVKDGKFLPPLPDMKYKPRTY